MLLYCISNLINTNYNDYETITLMKLCY